jgi:phosphotriesterase-related protein
MDRASLRGRAQTVLGPVAPEALGPTLMHEHILVDIRPPSKRAPEHQGPEIPRPEALAKIAHATGAHIVMGCGHYVDEYPKRGMFGSVEGS